MLETVIITQELIDTYPYNNSGIFNQAKQLIEDGFEYVCTSNNVLLFRRRK